jgi:hypothetical protein
MNMPKWLFAIIALVIAFTLFDIGFRLVILGLDTVRFDLFNFKGDIDFVSIGIINTLVRLAFLVLTLVSFKKARLSILPVLAVTIIPFIYLFFTSLDFFEFYWGLYMYWVLLFALCAWLTAGYFVSSARVRLHWTTLSIASIGTYAVIFLEYQRLFNWNVTRDWYYSLILHFFFDIALLFVVGATLIHDQTTTRPMAAKHS